MVLNEERNCSVSFQSCHRATKYKEEEKKTKGFIQEVGRRRLRIGIILLILMQISLVGLTIPYFVPKGTYAKVVFGFYQW